MNRIHPYTQLPCRQGVAVRPIRPYGCTHIRLQAMAERPSSFPENLNALILVGRGILLPSTQAPPCRILPETGNAPLPPVVEKTGSRLPKRTLRVTKPTSRARLRWFGGTTGTTAPKKTGGRRLRRAHSNPKAMPARPRTRVRFRIPRSVAC